MTVSPFSREQVLQLMRQIDQSVMPDNMDDFTLHFCTQGDFVHCEVKREGREVELVVSEEDKDAFGGTKQARFLRHKVEEEPMEPVGEEPSETFSSAVDVSFEPVFETGTEAVATVVKPAVKQARTRKNG